MTVRFRRVALLGPSHFTAFSGLASAGVEALATPLGLVPADHELASAAEAFDVVAPEPTAHAREHSLEVQLPFLQVVLGEFTTLALLTGSVTPGAVVDVLDQAIGAPDAIGVISTDLSPYLDYETAGRQDARTAEAITQLRPEDLALALADASGCTARRVRNSSAPMITRPRRQKGSRM